MFARSLHRISRYRKIINSNVLRRLPLSAKLRSTSGQQTRRKHTDYGKARLSSPMRRTESSSVVQCHHLIDLEVSNYVAYSGRLDHARTRVWPGLPRLG